jgi:hypothetical protein
MTAMSVPDRSLQQRMEALQNANEIRTYRANLKRDIKAGRADVVNLLINPPDEIETMHIFDLMMAVPKLGRVKVNKVLSKCRISPSKPALIFPWRDTPVAVIPRG